ncbi:uncharacterized protein [Sinocyclocheilus grahami]|uniref:uncharacterized protein isoform X2 n=1 Tax=Sinocyclocheilus grahami TaxID=75366 RepID=UPI0007AC814F|nr:PREDICTED: uncharacterized protein LOC107561455 isoform X2 [Sinocyclocheilus grahami]
MGGHCLFPVATVQLAPLWFLPGTLPTLFSMATSSRNGGDSGMFLRAPFGKLLESNVTSYLPLVTPNKRGLKSGHIQNILTKPLIPRLIGLEFHCRHKLVTNPVKLWKLLDTTHYFSTSNRRHEKKEGGKGKTPEEDEGIF